MKGARPLTPEEIAAVSQSFCGKYAVRDKCLFLLGINIGARVSELTALQVGDVWQHSRPVDILTLRKGTVKGKKESHFVPLNSTAKAVILELMEWKKMQDEDTKPGAYLFASRKGSGRLSRVQAHRILKKAYQHAFLTGKVTTHSMRKTVANTVYSATSDLFVVKEILGHKNLSTTQQYLGVGFEKLQEAMDTLVERAVAQVEGVVGQTHRTQRLDECNLRYNTLHSQDKLKKAATLSNKSIRKSDSKPVLERRDEGKILYFEKKS